MRLNKAVAIVIWSLISGCACLKSLRNVSNAFPALLRERRVSLPSDFSCGLGHSPDAHVDGGDHPKDETCYFHRCCLQSRYTVIELEIFRAGGDTHLFYIYSIHTKSIRDQRKAEAERGGVTPDEAVRTCMRCATRALWAPELTN